MLVALLRHDRALVLWGLIAVITLAWAWLLLGAGVGMDEMDMGGGQIMMMAPAWTPGYAALVVIMWVVMMAAMMLPSAAPAILLVAALMRQRGDGRQLRASWVFACGYLAVWFGFSLMAAVLQWGLDQAGLLSDTMVSGSVVLAGLLLIAAGIYQWTPWKQACLRQCRSPFELLTRYWRQGALGPAWAGVRHGAYCLGCCWMLMAVLVAFGTMQLWWMAALAALILFEKVSSFGERVAHVAGIVFVLIGAVLLLHPTTISYLI